MGTVGEAGLGSVRLPKWGHPGSTSGSMLLLARVCQGLHGVLCTLAYRTVGTEELQARHLPVPVVQVVNALAIWAIDLVTHLKDSGLWEILVVDICIFSK